MLLLDDGPDLTPTLRMTNPGTALLVQAVPVLLGICIVLLAATLLRTTIGRLLLRQAATRAAARHREAVDAALLFVPRTVQPNQVLMVILLVLIAMISTLGFIAPLLLVLLLAVPLTVALTHLLLATYTQRYVAQIDRSLPAAVGRLHTQLRAANSFQVALGKVVVDVGAGPLKDEWQWLIEHVNLPLSGGGLATPVAVVHALGAQTPSQRHATFLSHLEIALGQTQDIQSRRVEAAYAALQESERERSAAQTELAQMRYSGIAIGASGIFLALYLVFTQWQRVVLAYTSPFGLLVGPIVLASLLLPIAGGYLLSRVDDVDY